MNSDAAHDGQKLFRSFLAASMALLLVAAVPARAEEAGEQRTRQMLESILKSAPTGIGVVENRVIVQVNEYILNLTGYSREELIGQSARIFYPTQEEYEYVGREKYRQIAEKGTGSVEVRWLRKDGGIRHVILSSTPLDPANLPAGVTFTVLDITERKLAESALVTHTRWFLSGCALLGLALCFLLIRLSASLKRERASAQVLATEQKRLRSIAANVPGVLYEFHATPAGEHGMAYLSERAAEVCGFDKVPALEEVFAEFVRRVHPEDREAFLASIQAAVAARGPWHREFRFIKPSGEVVWFSGSSNLSAAPDRLIFNGLILDITGRKRMEEALRGSEAQFRSIIESSPVGYHIYTLEADGRLVFNLFNPAADAILRISHKPFVGRGILEAFPALAGTGIPEMYTAVARGELGTQNFEVPYDHEGIRGVYEVRVFRGAPGQAVVNFVDISERKQAQEEREKLQAQLGQAQKMESVGRLAGGVAHDFNNMLQAILGNTALALMDLPPDSPHRENLEEIQKSAQRSADLTRQLLAFARKQTIAPRVLDLNETVAGMLKMLRRLIGEDIELVWVPGRDLWPVRLDPSQVDQILANLCVNARDAIGGVGKVTLETDNATIDEDYCARHAGCTPGDYVLLAVSDNGCGMDTETLSHLFEPFFTTKAMGKGTGLGLAGVYGAVRQNQGFLNVNSEPGRGTTFKIYLPRHAPRAAQETAEDGPQAAARGSETILLAEDEPAILKFAQRMLERLGYTVLAARTPGEAIRLAREHPGRIDLLLSDVIMPEMNGRDLARNLQSIHPNIRRLFVSGYTAEVIAHQGVLDPGVHFLQKPFSPHDLGAKVREALEHIS